MFGNTMGQRFFGAKVMPLETLPPLPIDVTPPVRAAESDKPNVMGPVLTVLTDTEVEGKLRAERDGLLSAAVELGERLAEFLARAEAARRAKLEPKLEILGEQCRAQSKRVGELAQELARQKQYINTGGARVGAATAELRTRKADLPDTPTWRLSARELKRRQEAVDLAEEKLRKAELEKSEAVNAHNAVAAELQSEGEKLAKLDADWRRVAGELGSKPARDWETGLQKIPRG